MRKMILGVLMSIAVSVQLLASTGVSDHRQENKENICLEVASFNSITNEWEEYSDRKLRSGKVYSLSHYDDYKINIGGVKFRFSKTIKSNENEYMDIYEGNLDNGTFVEIAGVTTNRGVLILKIKDEDMKKVVCIPQ